MKKKSMVNTRINDIKRIEEKYVKNERAIWKQKEVNIKRNYLNHLSKKMEITQAVPMAPKP